MCSTVSSVVLIMTVNPGFGGQSFIPAMVDKVKRVKALIGRRPIRIEIDGGVSPETAPLVTAAGADVLIAGAAIFKGGGEAAYREEHRGDQEGGGQGAGLRLSGDAPPRHRVEKGAVLDPLFLRAARRRPHRGRGSGALIGWSDKVEASRLTMRGPATKRCRL